MARSLARRGFGSDDATTNALESVKAAALGSLATALAAKVRALLADAPASPPRPPGVLASARLRVRAWHGAWSERRSVTLAVVVFFALYTGATFG